MTKTVLSKGLQELLNESFERELRAMVVVRSYSYGFGAIAYPMLYDEPEKKPVDPLDAFHDGLSLRTLIALDDDFRQERRRRNAFTPAQQQALSAHWSKQLREKLRESVDKERHQVVCDPQDEP